MSPVIFVPDPAASGRGAARMDSQFSLYSQTGLRLLEHLETASEADLDQRAQKRGHRASKPWAQPTGRQWGM